MSNRWIVSVLLLAGVAFPASAIAQEAQPQFTRSWCIKAAEGKGRDYVDLMESYGKKVAAARVGTGNLVGWALWQAIVPGGRAAVCDFVAIYSFDGFPQSMMPLGEALKKAGVPMSEDEYRAKRASLSHIVESSIWTGVAAVGEIEEGDYIQFNYMKVHDSGEWLDLQRNFWRGLMEARVEDGTLKAWRSARRVLPGGSGVDYNAGTADVFPSWEAIGAPGRMQRALQKAHPGKEWRDISHRNQAARDTVMTEIWRVRLLVAP